MNGRRRKRAEGRQSVCLSGQIAMPVCSTDSFIRKRQRERKEEREIKRQKKRGGDER